MAIDLGPLGPARLGNGSSDPESDLVDTEISLGISLPSELRMLLLTFGGAVMFGNGARFRPDQRSGREGSDGFLTLISLYGLGTDENGIRTINRTYEQDIPKTMVVIGDSSGGDQICLDRVNSGIYFWRHDAENVDAALTFVASSFSKFMESLFPDESAERPIAADLGIVEGDSYLDF